MILMAVRWYQRRALKRSIINNNKKKGMRYILQKDGNITKYYKREVTAP
jgi:hypothetical protein